jgi:broad specificity polyphosphatase/5'/3'-nucleotidase SurE
MTPGQYLTVNFPDGPAANVRGVRWAAPGRQVFHDAFEMTGRDAKGGQIWKQRWWFDDGEQPADRDVALQREGWITVTPMRLGDLDALRLDRDDLPTWGRE